MIYFPFGSAVGNLSTLHDYISKGTEILQVEGNEEWKTWDRDRGMAGGRGERASQRFSIRPKELPVT
jgi:hypothetical protein